MRISKVSIRNYRCLASFDLEIDDYTVLIGANGVGKSSVLYALDWFFNGGSLGTADIHGGAHPTTTTASGPTAPQAHVDSIDGHNNDDGTEYEDSVDDREVSVEVTFTDLSPVDREELGRYGHGPNVRFRRTWIPASGEEKIVGNAHQGPGFAEVRSAGTAPETKSSYADLCAARPDLGLSPATSKKAILEGLDRWEADPANSKILAPIANSDATHMFGVQGENRLERRIRYVLIPAATDIASQVGESGRGSTLSRLVGGLVASAVSQARETWTAKHQPVLNDLTTAISSAVSTATDSHTARVNSRLAALLPTAEILIEPQMPDWRPKIDPTLSTSVVLDGRTHDVSRQGHGVQRAVMIAMLQALVPSDAGETATAAHRDGEEEYEEAHQTDAAPTFIVAIEEPEIYQHPVRARHLARALWDLSRTAQNQVLLATHSPYFVRPEQFESLRRVVLRDGCSDRVFTTAAEVAAACGVSVTDVERRLEKELPRTFSEGFFADAAVLVEGDTDKVILETIAERIGLPLDAAGVAVLSVGGKSGLRLAFELLERLGTPTYVMFDGDYLGAKRKHADDAAAEQNVHGSHNAATNKILSWVPSPTTITRPAFGDPSTVTERFFVLHDDLEHELSTWTGYHTELAANGIGPRGKDVGAYRAAAAVADLADVPSIFQLAVTAMLDTRQT